MTTATTATRTHYFIVNVMDTNKSFWTFQAALDDLRVRTTRAAEHIRTEGLWIGDIYAYDVTTERVVTGSSFGRAIAGVKDGKVVVKVPAQADGYGEWVVAE